MGLESKHIDWIIVVLNKNVRLHLNAFNLSQVLDTSTLLFQLNVVLFDRVYLINGSLHSLACISLQN